MSKNDELDSGFYWIYNPWDKMAEPIIAQLEVSLISGRKERNWILPGMPLHHPVDFVELAKRERIEF